MDPDQQNWGQSNKLSLFTIHKFLQNCASVRQVSNLILKTVNIKMSSYQYRNSHYQDKMVSWPSYLYNGNTHTWKDSLYIEMRPRFPMGAELEVHSYCIPRKVSETGQRSVPFHAGTAHTYTPVPYASSKNTVKIFGKWKTYQRRILHIAIPASGQSVSLRNQVIIMKLEQMGSCMTHIFIIWYFDTHLISKSHKCGPPSSLPWTSRIPEQTAKQAICFWT